MERKAARSDGNMCCLLPASAWCLLRVNSHGRLHHWQPLMILISCCLSWQHSICPGHVLLRCSSGWMDMNRPDQSDTQTWETDLGTTRPTSGWDTAAWCKMNDNAENPSSMEFNGFGLLAWRVIITIRLHYKICNIFKEQSCWTKMKQRQRHFSECDC